MKQFIPFQLERLGIVMEGDPANPHEALGVLNPAFCRARDGTALLYPRVVAAGNYSRIGLAEVCFTADRPTGVRRRGYALEPAVGFERNTDTAGVEDPRVTFVPALDRYIMTYTAFGPLGPRIALALSADGVSWRRLGQVKFAYEPRYATDFDLYPNKDALLFPEPVRDPQGRAALALIHRPDFNAYWWRNPPYLILPEGVTDPRPAIWLSYAPLDRILADERDLLFWFDHQLLAAPDAGWEGIKVGGGTPPVRTRLGWLTLYHGVGQRAPGADGRSLSYAAGALVLDHDDPRRIVYRSPQPILAPSTPAEQEGVVDHVVFPTGIDARDADTHDVYYGMADARIGVARLRVPERLD